MPRRFIQRFKTIDRLIQKKETGNAIQLAKKLDVSERTAKEFIMVMRENGAPIFFDRLVNSYCYTNPGKFNISFIIVQ
jgi:predicted DNA-binding transcriptional regulator YafY